jgi:hypothetical protein
MAETEQDLRDAFAPIITEFMHLGWTEDRCVGQKERDQQEAEEEANWQRFREALDRLRDFYRSEGAEAIDLLREMVKHGEHEGACTNVGMEYEGACDLHVEAGRRRTEAARQFLARLAQAEGA